MKKILLSARPSLKHAFASAWIAAFASSAFAALPCGKALLVAPAMDQRGVRDSDYSSGRLRDLRSYYESAKEILQEEKGYSIVNGFTVSEIDRSSIGYDYVIYVDYSTNSSDPFSPRTYSASVYDRREKLLEEGEPITRGFSTLPRTEKWLREATRNLESCRGRIRSIGRVRRGTRN